MRRIGVHTSIAGGIRLSLERARVLGCSTLQIFSHNPRQWALSAVGPQEAEEFKRLRQELDISPVFIHTSYLINLASGRNDLLIRSSDMVAMELDIADSIGAEYVVIHTGSASGDEPAEARGRAISVLRALSQKGSWNAGLLLENTAGERGDITSTMRDIAEILHAVPGGLLAGICLDTCHAFAAGYDLRTASGIDMLAEEIVNHIGIDRVRLIHLNDSRGSLGARVDRHQHIGEGAIGMDGLRYFVRHPLLSSVPLVLETPKKTDDDDPRNLSVVRGLLE